MKLGAAGNVLHAATYGGGGFDRIWSVAVDSAESVLVTGEYTPDALFGGAVLGGDEISGGVGFVAKYDASGAHLWSMRTEDGPATRLVARKGRDEFVAAAGCYGNALTTYDAEWNPRAGAPLVTPGGRTPPLPHPSGEPPPMDSKSHR